MKLCLHIFKSIVKHIKHTLFMNTFFYYLNNEIIECADTLTGTLTDRPRSGLSVSVPVMVSVKTAGGVACNN